MHTIKEDNKETDIPKDENNSNTNLNNNNKNEEK